MTYVCTGRDISHHRDPSSNTNGARNDDPNRAESTSIAFVKLNTRDDRGHHRYEAQEHEVSPNDISIGNNR